jgi:tetratricopeptide (TPR) repeat protein/Sec-independent protein translocase protein TatA
MLVGTGKLLVVAALGLVFMLPALGRAQDLGSIGGMIRTNTTGTKSSTSKKTTKPEAKEKSSSAKKETAKKETANSKSKTPVKSASAAKKPAAKTSTAAKNTTTKPKTTQTARTIVNAPIQNDIIIKVGQKTSGSYDEMFEQAIEEGNFARDDRSYAGAEAAYRRAQNLKPKDSRAIYGLGNLYSDQQRWEEAEKAYRQAIALEPESPEAHIALSFVLAQPVSGVNLADRYTEAEKMARKAIALDSLNPVAHNQLGASLELRGIIEEETKNAYRTAIRLDPNFALAYAHLGRLLRRNGLTNESSEAYRDAVRLATDVPTMILVAEVMQSQQRFTESEQLLRRALREDPKNPTALYLLGRALTTRSSFAEAERFLNTSLEVSPNSFVAYALLSSLYTRQNRFEDAENILMKSVQMISANERKRLSTEFEIVGDGLSKAGRRKDAARLYQQALKLDSKNIQVTTKLNKVQ